MLRVVVVDDHPVVREGLKRILSEHNEIVIAAEAGDGVEAVDVVRRTPCDVVLLDVKLPNRSGLDVLKQLHAEMPRLPVLMLSMYSEDQYAMRVLRAGAAGYLTKESAPSSLVQAVRRVARGGKYVSTAFAERLASSLERDTDRPPMRSSRTGNTRLCACSLREKPWDKSLLNCAGVLKPSAPIAPVCSTSYSFKTTPN